MASVYRRALTTQGSARFVLAAFVGRIPISMLGIGTVLYIQEATGSYGVGGTVVTAATLGEALSAARIGRALDRFGQARVLVLCLLGHLVGLLGLLVTVSAGAPRPLWYLFAVIMGGVFPPTGSCSRARWSACLTDGDLLGAAFSLEAAVDEVIFITGPVLATVLATAVAPGAGLIAAGVLLTVGTLALAAQRGTDPGPRPDAGAVERPRVFRDPALRALLLVLVAVGVSFGATDVTTVAFGRQHGLGAFSGVLLALFALGSATSGLFWGARPAGDAFARRFLVACGCMAFALWLPWAAPNVPLLIPLVVLTGATVAPSMAGANTVMERLVPAAARTEGFAWLQVALVAGISAGAPLAGATIDRFGARSGWAVAAGAGVLVGLAALGGQRAVLGARVGPEGPAGPATPGAVAVGRSEMSGRPA
ncbi:MFS transporter [Pseudofrankia sp. DC12]|uniref:MFS transporter n=1 Tax=Pseudofrankia sp. DC12 TaxID=683315 RepID=UPI0005F831F4|nr:MFS transporter [Pseudofrankia sp. DC12]